MSTRGPDGLTPSDRPADPARRTSPLARFGVAGALLAALLGGWLWGASGRWELTRAIQASELRHDLTEARASLLGARVSLCEADFGEMSRHLENARTFVGRSGARLGTPDPDEEPLRRHLADFRTELDEAQRLTHRLNPGAGGAVHPPDRTSSARNGGTF